MRKDSFTNVAKKRFQAFMISVSICTRITKKIIDFFLNQSCTVNQ